MRLCPYTALLDEQAWVPVVDGTIAPDDLAGPLWAELDGLTPDDVAERLSP